MRYLIVLYLFLHFTGVSAQKYKEAFDQGQDQRCLKYADKAIKKQYSNLEAHMYKALAYARLSADTLSKDYNGEAEKATMSVKSIASRDRQENFRSAHTLEWRQLEELLLPRMIYYLNQDNCRKVRFITDRLWDALNRPTYKYIEGRCEEAAGNTIKAMDCYNLAARQIYLQYLENPESAPHLPEVFIRFAQNLAMEHFYDQAFTILERGITLYPDDPEIEDALLHTASMQLPELKYATLGKVDTALQRIGGYAGRYQGQKDWLRLKWTAACQYIETANRVKRPTAAFMQEWLQKTRNAEEAGIARRCVLDLLKKEWQSSIQYNRFELPVGNTLSYLSDLAGLWNSLPQAPMAAPAADDWWVLALLAFQDDHKSSLPASILTSIEKALEVDLREKDLIKLNALCQLFPDDVAINNLRKSSYIQLATQGMASHNYSMAATLLYEARDLYPAEKQFLELKKQLVIDDYLQNYLGSSMAYDDLGWTGNINCQAGHISDLAYEKTLQRFNYLRRTAGIPDNCTFDEELNRYAQHAAMIMYANGDLSHHPPTTWKCLTDSGIAGAGSSNLSLGYHSVNALMGQMEDYGYSNYAVGHRRWILLPSRKAYGLGCTPATMALKCIGGVDAFYPDSLTKQYSEQPVTWPPRDYIPKDLVFPRWSFSLPGLNFADAEVKMYENGQPIAVHILEVEYGYGNPTLVWEPDISPYDLKKETTYKVVIGHCKKWRDEDMRTYTYEVIVMPSITSETTQR